MLYNDAPHLPNLVVVVVSAVTGKASECVD